MISMMLRATRPDPQIGLSVLEPTGDATQLGEQLKAMKGEKNTSSWLVVEILGLTVLDVK